MEQNLDLESRCRDIINICETKEGNGRFLAVYSILDKLASVVAYNQNIFTTDKLIDLLNQHKNENSNISI